MLGAVDDEEMVDAAEGSSPSQIRPLESLRFAGAPQLRRMKSAAEMVVGILGRIWSRRRK